MIAPTAAINNPLINAAAKEKQQVSAPVTKEQTINSYADYQNRVKQSYKAMQEKKKKEQEFSFLATMNPSAKK